MVMRISGFSSGLDIDNMVSQLMKAQRMPADKLTRKKTTLQWQREGYRDLNSKILDFRSNKLFNYRLSKTYSAKKVDVSGNTTAVTAKANGDAVTGTFKVEVGTLATASTNFSSNDIRTNTAFDATKTIASQTSNLSSFSSNSFAINGTTINFDPTTESLNDVIAKINQTTNVNAFYDASSGKVSFSSKQTGLTNNVTDVTSQSGKYITFSGDFLTSALQVSTASASAVAASNATVTINGLQTTQTSNAFTVSGIQITANQAGGTAAYLNVSTDTDKIVDSIKSFISDYNDTLKTLQDKVSEPKYRDFQPLTDDQKKEMKDKDIESWEKKAKSGLFKNDDIFTRAISNMRTDANTPVETGDLKYRTLTSIGIETGAYNENGKLYLVDEQKLRDAIQANPNAVSSIFTASGADSAHTGIAERMYNNLKETLDDITKKAGFPSLDDSSSRDNSILGKQLFQVKTDIDNFTGRLKGIEDRYYRQFSAMEAAMNKFNSQSQYLAGALGGGQK